MTDKRAPNEEEYLAISEIDKIAAGGPVLMINTNNHRTDAGFPDSKPYTGWVKVLPNWYKKLEQNLVTSFKLRTVNIATVNR